MSQKWPKMGRTIGPGGAMATEEFGTVLGYFRMGFAPSFWPKIGQTPATRSCLKLGSEWAVCESPQ